MQGSLFFPKIVFFFLKPNVWDLGFSKNAYVVFIKKSEFFFLKKKTWFLTKTFTFRENLHFDNLKCEFPSFCMMGGQKLGNARNSKKAKSGVSQIHL